MQAYHQKTEKFFVSKEKKFYRIGYILESYAQRTFDFQRLFMTSLYARRLIWSQLQVFLVGKG